VSERFSAAVNVNKSKNTRLPIADEFSNFRFGRDALAHVSRYLWVIDNLIALSKEFKRPLKVIDVGCGDCYIPRTFAASYAIKKTDIIEQYVGVDIDDKRIERTRATFPQSVPHRIDLGDFTVDALQKYGDKEFDVLVNLEVLEHIQPELVRPALVQFKRIAHRGWISTPNGTGGTGQIPEDHIKEWDCQELSNLMKDVGFWVQRRIGIFSNLMHVRQIAKTEPRIQELLDFLEPRMDKHFLSLTMARLIGGHAQNIFYICNFDGAEGRIEGDEVIPTA